MIALLALSAALAQTTGGAAPTLNAQLFHPSVDATKTLWADDTFKAPNGYLLGRLAVHYAKDPAIWVDSEGEVVKLVSDVVATSFLGAYTAGPVRLGLDVPVYLRSFSPATNDETGIGDIALDVKGTLLDRRRSAVGLALAGRASLPTTTVAAPLGNGGFGWEVQGIVDREFTDRLLATLNLGTRGVPRTELENFEWNDQLFVRGGLAYGGMDTSGVSLEVASHTNYASFGTPKANPAELLLGGWTTAVKSLRIRGAVGTGLTSGLGAPQLRLVSMVGYEPPREVDTDGDGLIDARDACPREPEDLDQVADDDGCPEATVVTVRVLADDDTPIPDARWSVDGQSGAHGETAGLYGGTYVVGVEAPGYASIEVEAAVPDAEAHVLRYVLEPLHTGVTVNVVDEHGAAIPGSTWWGPDGTVHPSGASVAWEPGPVLLTGRAEGFTVGTREVEVAQGETSVVTLPLDALAVVEGDRIDIRDSVFFETAKAVIRPESFELLDTVASLIRDHPEILRLRIEGHTDERGGEDYNLDLSQRRADAVRTHLVEEGVEPERLVARGYGESAPLVEGHTEEAWAQNRRVDFFIIERSDE